MTASGSTTTARTLPGLGLLLAGALAVGAPTHAADLENGKLLAEVARCEACHTVDPEQPYGGGYALETKFGTFYGTNLTPGEAGIGSWSLDDFVRALDHGRSPDGQPYYPAFPYPSFTQMSEADMADVFAYLQTISILETPNRPHVLEKPYRGLWKMRLWKAVAFAPRDLDPVDRGRYLVDAVAHCGECHSGRGGLGKTRRDRYLAGSDDPPEPAPNITPAKLPWNVEDWQTFLTDGMSPDGDFVGGEMRSVIIDGTAKLPDADLEAMAAYLVSVKPKAVRGAPPEPDEEEEEEDEPWL